MAESAERTCLLDMICTFLKFASSQNLHRRPHANMHLHPAAVMMQRNTQARDCGSKRCSEGLDLR